MKTCPNTEVHRDDPSTARTSVERLCLHILNETWNTGISEKQPKFIIVVISMFKKKIHSTFFLNPKTDHRDRHGASWCSSSLLGQLPVNGPMHNDCALHTAKTCVQRSSKQPIFSVEHAGLWKGCFFAWRCGLIFLIHTRQSDTYSVPPFRIISVWPLQNEVLILCLRFTGQLTTSFFLLFDSIPVRIPWLKTVPCLSVAGYLWGSFSVYEYQLN